MGAWENTAWPSLSAVPANNRALLGFLPHLLPLQSEYHIGGASKKALVIRAFPERSRRNYTVMLNVLHVKWEKISDTEF